METNSDLSSVLPSTSDFVRTTSATALLNLDANVLQDYNSYLDQQREHFIQEKQNNERLSNSIENYVIEDAKVNFKKIYII